MLALPTGQTALQLCRTLSRNNRVIRVLNGQHSAPTQPHRAGGVIFGRQPEVPNPGIGVLDLALFDPERRVLGWLRLNAHDREVLAIHPDPAAIEKFVLELGLQAKHVDAEVANALVLQQAEFVVPRVQGR